MSIVFDNLNAGLKYHFYKTKFVLQQLLMVEIAQVVSLGQRYMEYPVLESSRHSGF